MSPDRKSKNGRTASKKRPARTTAQKRVAPEPHLKPKQGANPDPIARRRAPAARDTDREQEARKWKDLNPIALKAFRFWNVFLDLRWGANNIKKVDEDSGEEQMFLTIIRCVSWVESVHGTGDGKYPDRDPMQCGNPEDAWWKSINRLGNPAGDRFVRGPEETTNYYANQLPSVMEGEKKFPGDAKLSKLKGEKAKGHESELFNKEMSFFWAVPILIHKINTNKKITDPRTFKCGDCSQEGMFNGADKYNGGGIKDYRSKIERAWKLIGGPSTARRRPAKKR